MNEHLLTERLDLRPFTRADADAWHRIWGDPEVIWWGANESFEQSRAGLERLIGREADWPAGIGWLAVLERGREEIIGDVLLQPAPFVDAQDDPAPDSRPIEIGWHFRRHAWGRGYATEASAAVMKRAFDQGVVEAIWAIVAEQNARSLRVADKLGMRLVRQKEYAGLPHRLFVRRAGEDTPPRRLP